METAPVRKSAHQERTEPPDVEALVEEELKKSYGLTTRFKWGLTLKRFGMRVAARVSAQVQGAPARAAEWHPLTTDEAFENWWARDGRWIDPDTSDVPWFDKRRELCALAFRAATAQSGNYVADDAAEPHAVTFANGRHVSLNPDGRFLEISTLPPSALTGNSETKK